MSLISKLLIIKEHLFNFLRASLQRVILMTDIIVTMNCWGLVLHWSAILDWLIVVIKYSCIVFEWIKFNYNYFRFFCLFMILNFSLFVILTKSFYWVVCILFKLRNDTCLLGIFNYILQRFYLSEEIVLTILLNLFYLDWRLLTRKGF